MKKWVLTFVFLISFCFSSDLLEKKLCSGSAEKIQQWKIRWQYARTLSYANKISEAEVQYEKLIDEKPKLIEPKVELLNLYLKQNKRDEALSILNRISLCDLDESTQFIAAELFVRDKNYQKAEEIYKRYLFRRGKDLNVRLNLASIYALTGRFDEAISQYKILLRKNPKDVQLHRKYAFLLKKAKKYKLAQEELEKSL